MRTEKAVMESTPSAASGGPAELEQPSMKKIEHKKMKVMVAIDESEGSFYALKWVLDNLCVHRCSAGNEPG